MDPNTRRALDEALTALAAADTGAPLPAERARAVRLRLERADRGDGGGDTDGLLVVGIVGPNNAGKSALFTALSGTDHSPSDARGGFTAELRAAAAPTVLDRARRALPAPTAEDGVTIEWAPAPALPAHLVLVDSPDFDSTATANHAAAAWMLRTADLLIVVVTKHTYGNAAVRTWIEEATARGRPYLLVHNESPSPVEAARQCEEMIATARFRPRSIWSAPNDLAVAGGTKPLRPVRIDGAVRSSSGGTQGGNPSNAASPTPGSALDAGTTTGSRPHASPTELTAASLPSPDEAASLVREARIADLTGLRDALENAVDAVEPTGHRAHALLERLGATSADFAHGLASAGMPLQPLLRALRTELDERSPTHGRWRGSVEFVPKVLQGLWSRAGRGIAGALGRSTTARDPAGPKGISPPEATALDRLMPSFVRTLEDVSPADGDATETAEARAARIRTALDALPPQLADHERACEEIVRGELERRGRSDDLQFVASSLAALPLVGGGALFIATGGIGVTDAIGAAVLGAGKPVVDAVLDRIGTGIVQKARDAWVREREAALADAVRASALPGRTARAQAAATAADHHLPALRAALSSTNDALRSLSRHDPST